jgi:hypothetical protein
MKESKTRTPKPLMWFGWSRGFESSHRLWATLFLFVSADKKEETGRS